MFSFSNISVTLNFYNLAIYNLFLNPLKNIVQLPLNLKALKMTKQINSAVVPKKIILKQNIEVVLR